ncbi:MAG TPA: hypothetical protein VGM84_19960 [Steroidobacteraceae bacterium]|jgi:hypothetical protein
MIDAGTRSNIALLVSVGSLLVSGAGFVISAVNAYRDRPRLNVSSKLHNDDNGDPYRIAVTVVNSGRRPVILRMIGGYGREGGWGGTYLESEKGGIRLGEHEQHVFKLEKEGVVLLDKNGPDVPYDSMWIEDTLGNRHKIPNSREHITRMHPPTGASG